ncbi:MAG TPA: hypothetical protein VF755_21860 [Catenuloplanes sp.]|jgi:hypothetical protein
MAAQPDDAPAQALPPGPRPATNRRLWVVVGIVAALLAVTALVVVIDWMTGDDGVDRGRDRVVSGPRDGRDRATFALLDGTKSVTVRTRDLGDRLYRVETPPGGARVPRVAVVGDEVKLGFGDSGRDGVAATDVQLSSAVRWQIRVLAGAAEQVIDLTGGKVAGVELAGGATRIELTLPPPEGTTTVRMSGGVGQWAVHQLGAAPVRVRVGSGAATVTVDAAQHNGVSGGTVFTPAGWDAARNRVDIDAVAGMSALVVDRR